VVPPAIRKVAAALALAVPCLLFAAPASASPIRKAHTHAPPARKVAHHRAMTPAQSFARLANRKPERAIKLHPKTWLKRAPHAPESQNHDAAITAGASLASAEAHQETPALRPLELLLPVQAQLRSQDGFAHTSPRAPPTLG